MRSDGAPTRVIALTGNIASGKSAVAEILQRKGATIIDADELSREAVTPGSPALDVRLERIVRDRGLETAEAMDMIASQMPAELKRARADWVIENAGSKKDLEREVDKLWDEIERDDVPLSASNAP